MSIPDYALETTFDYKFTTRAFATGIPTTLGGTPVVDVYEDNSLTQITTAETLTVDFDSVTGLNNLRIAATAANGFESGKSYAAVITTGTVGGVSVVGEVVLNFSIERTSAVRPTTAGRTLDIAATGEAGIDLDNTNGALGTSDFDADFLTAALIADNAFVAANFAASSLDGKGDWNTTTPPTAAAIVNEWETQSQLDPTGFHVNVLEVNGTAQTANDNGADINTLITQIGTAGAGLTDLGGMSTAMKAEVNAECDTALTDYDAVVPADLPTNFADLSITLTTGRVDVASIGGTSQTANDNGADINAILADTNELQGDWANGGRLDLILDARASQTTADAIETDTQDIQSRIPAALVSGRMSSDAVAISGSTEAADNLEASAETIVVAAAATGTLSTTQMTTNLTEVTDDHYNGRIIIWTSGVLQDQATDITDYDGGTKLLTYTATTEAPSNGDTFVIV